MTRKILFALVSVILFTAVDCKDEPTKPPVSDQPPDTTSHNFVVTRIDTLGDWFSTAFCVDILDEINIWVGGEFTTKDSAGNYRNFTHNLAKWDGERWTKSRVEFIGWNNTGPDIQQIGAIKVFSDSSMFLLTRANSYAYYKSGKWTTQYIYPFGATYMWARSDKSIFFAGAGYGYAGFWNGDSFSRMTTSISNPPFFDIWGDENQVYTLGSPDNTSRDGSEYVFLYSTNTTNCTIANRYEIYKQAVPPNVFLGRLLSVYRANMNTKLWVLGGEYHGSLYEVASLSPFSAKEFFKIPTVLFPKYIRGNADNDLFIFGSTGGSIWHYNGSTWKMIFSSDNFYLQSCAVRGNTVVLAGETPGGIAQYGIVITLKRY